jgi:SAM-dependent methyltransferase
VFERAAETYERMGPAFFSHHGRRLVEIAGLQAGGRVLDVAAGAGAVLLPAAERVGPHGQVVGVDLAASMVGRLRQELAARGVGNAAVCRMDAQALGFPGARFDVVLCGFALDAVPRPERALVEFHRVLGAVAGWAWQSRPTGGGRVMTAGAGMGAAGVGGCGRARGGCRGSAGDWRGGAGRGARGRLRAVAVAEELFPLVFTDAQQWWRWAWSHGDRQVLEAMDQATLERYRAACFEQLRALWGSGAVDGRLKVWLVLSIGPDGLLRSEASDQGKRSEAGSNYPLALRGTHLGRG